jgi:predicted DNA-binding transcriptional regulator AlpA
MQIDFNSLPTAIEQLCNDMATVKNLLLSKSCEKQTEPDRWLNIKELCDYHPDKPTRATVYGWVSQRKIPVHKGSKALRFLKSEIDQWLRQGRVKTNAEIAQEVDNYLVKKMRG